MTRRSKVKMEYTTDDTRRKTSYIKRKKGLFKKLEELSTLCGVEACAIVYGENDTEPEVWPKNSGFQSVLTKFSNMSEAQQHLHMDDVESFLLDRNQKAEEKMKQLKKENQERQLTLVMNDWLDGKGPNPDDLSMVDINEIRSLIDKRLQEFSTRIKTLEEESDENSRAMSAQNDMNFNNNNNNNDGAGASEPNGGNDANIYQWSSLAERFASTSLQAD